LEYCHLRDLSKGVTTVAGKSVSACLVVLRRRDWDSDLALSGSESAPRPYYTVVSKVIQLMMASKLFRCDWDQICHAFDLMKSVPKRATTEGWLWDSYCDSVIPLKTVLQLTRPQAGLASSKATVKLVANLPTNVIPIHSVMSASVHHDSGKPGYYRIKIETQTSFDAFSITEENRVILFRYTSNPDHHDGLSPVGLDQLADAFRGCGKEDLLPYTEDGLPRKGAEWWIVWVVPEKIKDGFIPTTKFTTRVTKYKKVDVEQTKWEDFVQHYVLGLDHNIDRPREYEEFKL
jgi:hypothetical protein